MPVCRQIYGLVLREGTSTPQPGVTVRVVTNVGRGEVPVGSCVTNADGYFSIELTSALPGSSGIYRLQCYDGTLRLVAHGDVEWSSARDARIGIELRPGSLPEDASFVGVDVVVRIRS